MEPEERLTDALMDLHYMRVELRKERDKIDLDYLKARLEDVVASVGLAQLGK